MRRREIVGTKIDSGGKIMVKGCLLFGAFSACNSSVRAPYLRYRILYMSLKIR